MYSDYYRDTFWLRQSKMLKNGQAPIYFRIFYRGKFKDISTRLSCDPADWLNESKMVRRNSLHADFINEELQSWRIRGKQCFEELNAKYAYFIVKDIARRMLDENRSMGLIPFIEKRINERMAISGKVKGNSPNTIQNYKTCLKHLRAFIPHQYKKEDVPLAQVNLSFIETFIQYLKVEKGLQNNSANKNVRQLRTIMNEALKLDAIDHNPFSQVQLRYERTEREFLSEDEVQLIMNKELRIPRLEQVRDVFVFACFTGLAYADMATLKGEHIIERNGDWFIKKNRQKSGVQSMIPLFPPAERILQRYSDYEDATGKLLPVSSNQKVNGYLKEIADLCGIQKDLTFHIARHTFATICLSNGISIESVSKMLGHRKISTTQIYARVLEGKLIDDTRTLHLKYGGM